ncbi:type I polyketide synthase [Streptomyces sp. RTd22]|uniref:type I polyketide synthase n=3 Tax=Streptomyces sp. RTd22 TaxID=1841249 RepID=UPI0007D9976C|nr:type I polyketide synthase [Streptomyces sp. RTd22]
MSSTSPEKILEALRVSLKETERLRKENQQITAAAREPIAIVGMGCRFPGGVKTPAELWSLLASGTDAVSGFPTDRGWADDLYDPDHTRHGKSYVREGAFVEGVTDFDAAFFGISPREALAMDPQHRILLETAWEALERAGYDPLSLKGSRTGVFAGTNGHDYGRMLREIPEELEGYLGTGSSGAVLSGRISYSLGLEGPAVTVDTACSSSLVTLHMAVQALRSDECSLALAGGVSIMTTPGAFVEFSRQNVLSPDGRCKAFADGADGTGWGEGAGMLLLERLSDARRNGHEVLALIRGSAVNQDGASNGLTAPNGPSQQRVIRQALANARVSAADVGAVEAHGTGTALGDPIEAQALIATYGQGRPADRPLWLGSLKSNIGHTQAAAGVAGVIKMVLALRHGSLPRTLHVGEPSTQVDWSAGAVRVLAEEQEWPEFDGRPRRAGVSSFGVSGTNVHVILERAPEPEPMQRAEGAPVAVPWVVSGRGAGALREQVARLLARVEGDPELSPVDVGWSLASGRAVLENRAVVTGGSREQLVAGLGALARGEDAPGVVAGPGAAGGDGRVVFVFPGQGSHWVGMAVELLDAAPVFAERMAECGRALTAFVDWDLESVLRQAPGAPPLERVDVLQPVTWAVMVSLAALWRSYGVEPSAVVGHSQGEIAAACVSGALALEDGARVVALRAQAIERSLSGRGGMLSIVASEEWVRERIEPFGARLSVAAVNGPNAVVVSGDADALRELGTVLAKAGVMRWNVPGVDFSAHSAHVESLEGELAEILAGVELRASQVPFYSTVTAGPLDTAELDAGYWYRNLRQPVRFRSTVEALGERGYGTFIEVSPHPVLAMGILETLESPERTAPVAVSTLRREAGGLDRFLTSLAELWVHGVDVDWRPAFADTGMSRVELPTYAFQRRRFWLENTAATSGDVTSVGLLAAEHPLLGAAVESAVQGGLIYTTRLSLTTQPWLADHRIDDVVVLPGSALVDMLTHVGEQVWTPVVEELTLSAPLAVPATGSTVVQLTVGAPDDRGRRFVRVHSRTSTGTGTEQDGWSEHAAGTLATWDDGRDADPAAPDLTAWPPQGAVETPVPQVAGVRAAWAAEGRVYAEVGLPESAEGDGNADRYGVHPAVLEAALHLMARLGLVLSPATDGGERLLAHTWSAVRAHATGARSLRVCLTPTGEDTVAVSAVDDAGAPVLDIGAVGLRTVSADELSTAARSFTHESMYQVDWVEVAGVAPYPVDHWSTYEDVMGGDVALPPVVVYEPGSGEPGSPLPERVHTVGQRMLEVLQGWLADPRTASSRLVVVTGADPAGTESELVADPVRGLLRSAQAENPGRFALLEADRVDTETLRRGLAAGAEEPWVAVRDGRTYVARLRRSEIAATPAADLGLAGGAALVTGATGGLGRLVTRHLAEAHGVTEVVLVSRSGQDDAWAAELASLGLSVRMVAADVADRAAMADIVASLGERLTAVVHAAGIVGDGLVTTLDPQQWHAVLRPKVDAAWHLHELTAGLDLRAFILFSSAASPFGGGGQGNYAAANGFLDSLARYRHAHGLPATSLAWGLWGPELGGMGGRLRDVDLARVAREGILPFSAEQGLELLDMGLTSGRPTLVPIRLDLPGLRRSGFIPAVLRDLVPHTTRRAVTRDDTAAAATDRVTLARRLTGLSPADRHKHLLDLVRDSAAKVLGYASGKAVDPHQPFRDVGFDSLTGIELRNQLAAATGLALPATLVFNYATPTALARHLRTELLGAAETAVVPVTSAVAADDDPIVIVGMGCRLPGGASSPEELWRLLASGDETAVPYPADRGWDIDGLYDPDPERSGKSYVREGSFLPDVAEFDPTFFGIAPREAVSMDPQQRLLLETAWEAIERAGIDPVSLRGTTTGVFAGTNGQDYSALLQRAPEESEGYLATGIAASVVSGRLSYTFGLEGPAVSVDTACSSSLVTLHLAAQALRNGECTLALAGGATVMTTPGLLVEFSRQRGLAPDGRSRAFSDAADGMAFGEGAGMVLLERLSDARRNGHPVLAVVRGSAVNQDGASNGLTAPNGPSQERVIRAALANARITAADVDAVEAHGTGTTLGDPIEAQALIATYGQGRAEGQPLWLGALKSTIGHTQAAAGVAGVIKMVLALRHGVLPRTLHVDEPSSKVDWDAGAVELLTEAREWPEVEGRPRRGGVSSFGVSGTNAHVILEQAPEAEPVRRADAAPVAVPWVVSGRGAEALRGQAARLLAHVEADGGLSPVDVGWSLASGRAVFENRAVVSAGSREQLVAGLGALARGEEASGLVTGMTAGADGRVVFVFPGQGSQWAGMAVELLDASPVFAERMAECAAALSGFVDWGLLDVVRGASSLERVDVVQPVSWAVMVSLAALWRSYGIEPAAVVGHSQGEIAAACVSGALSLEDGARVVALRSQAIAGGLAGRGGMASVALPLAEVEARLTRWAGRLEVAALNGPTSVVVAGEPEALDGLVAECETAEIRIRRIAVDYASHTSHVELIEEELARVLAEVRPQTSEVPFFSTVTSEWLDTTKLDASYWYRNLRQTVRFQSAVETLAEQEYGAFVEVSSHPVLTMSVQEVLEGAARTATPVVAGTLRRDDGGLDRFLTSLAELWVQGVDVDWTRAFADTGATVVDLPTYAFQRRRYWLTFDAAATGDMASAGLLPAEHPLLGAAVELPDTDGIVFTGRLAAQGHSWLTAAEEHTAALLPGTAFVELAVRAGDEVGCDVLEELTLRTPLVLPARGGVQLRVSVAEPDAAGRRTFGVHARPEDEAYDTPWTCHATGVLAAGDGAAADWDLVAWPPAGAVAVETDALDGLWKGVDGEVFAEVGLAEEQQAEAARYGLHPALFDAALDAARYAAEAGPLWLPSSWRGVALHASGASVLRVRISGATGEPATFSVALADATGAPVASVDELALTRLDPEALPAGQEAGQGAVRTVTRGRPARRTAAASAGATDEPALVRRLAGLGHAEQIGVLSDLVRAETAAVLGHAEPGTVDLHRGFFEQGFNSLMSVDLRNRLSAATGLRLPTAFLFEHTKPTAAVAHLQRELSGSGDSETSGAGGIEAMFRQAYATGKFTAGNDLIMAASNFRDAFDAASAAEHLPEPVRMAVGEARPGLFCLPAVVATAGPQQYTRFAEHFRGHRDVTVLPQPGFLYGENVPADMHALAELHAQSLRRAAGDEPFVLLGHSAGGHIAHAVTEHLESLGTPPAALVLLDVPWPEDDETNLEVAVSALGVVFDREEKLGGGIMNDTRLTAMGGYHRILGQWQPEPIKTPTLLVRATEPVPAPSGAPEDARMLNVEWKLSHTAREVPGDHFTIVEQHAENTASVVEKWLEEIG